MLWAVTSGSLELRSEGGATRLTARFPYGRETEIAPGRHEVIAPRAFAARIQAGGDVHLLAGHSYDRPLASRSAGSLVLTDSDEALTVEATLTAEAAQASWARDFLAAHAAGLVRGLSPGFRVSDGGERIERRAAGVLRTVTAADLFEISAVTRPAYSEAQIEARCWETHKDRQPRRSAAYPLNRWRA